VIITREVVEDGADPVIIRKRDEAEKSEKKVKKEA
jgi:hypothetical protein